jgi:hypothetical protein
VYRTCIYCTADLGQNEAVEGFPVGRTLAFDAARGRLWAVCPKCARWNLAPLEERWEPVEAAERCFVDARLRVQSENVGLARLPDGTQLVRVGRALEGEVAAWRYGRELQRRRWKNAPAQAVSLALRVGAIASPWVYLGMMGTRVARGLRVVHQIPAERSPAGQPIVIRRGHLTRSWRQPDDDGDLALHIPGILPAERDGKRWHVPSLLLRGENARRVLSRAVLDANAGGASAHKLERALGKLAERGSSEEYLRSTAAQLVRLDVPDLGFHPRGWREVAGWLRGERRDRPFKAKKLDAPGALALEMALHEEQERRALEGELHALEAAWREAEEIAAIADGLAI